MAVDRLLLLDLLLFVGLACLALGHLLAGRDHRLRLSQRDSGQGGPDSRGKGKDKGGAAQRWLVLPRKTGHLVSGLGYLAFGIFWVGQVGHFREAEDPVNALFAAAALPFFAYLAYHEYLSYRWDEVYPSLRWLGATAVVAGGIYFTVDRVPLITGALVQVVADQSAWVMTHLLNYPSSTGGLDYGTSGAAPPLFRPGAGHESVEVELISANHSYDVANLTIYIVLACTALQSMIIFIGGIICTKMDKDPPLAHKAASKSSRWTLPRRMQISLGGVAGLVLLLLVVLTYRYPAWADLLIFLALAWMMIFTVLLFFVTKSRRVKAFLLTVPVIYFLNLLRNAGVATLAYTGTTTFETAHSLIGKGGSLLALVILAVATFTLLPELHDNILGLFDLPKRKRGGASPPTSEGAAQAPPPTSPSPEGS